MERCEPGENLNDSTLPQCIAMNVSPLKIFGRICLNFIVPHLSFSWVHARSFRWRDCLSLYAFFLLGGALLLPGQVYADFQTGLEAFDRGEYSTALEEWKPLAEKGDPSSQVNIGHLYAKGRGVKKDYLQALHWFRLAADQGVANAQYNLGAMYQEGLGLAKDVQEALEWYRLAARQGHVDAQYALGILYRNGQEEIQNPSLADCWLHEAVTGYKKMAQEGHDSAQYRLGVLYEYGLGVEPDKKAAVHWYHLAADQGNPDAQYKLGYLYALGEGTPQDYLHAHIWANLAGANGHERAAALRDRIAANMSNDQIANAQHLASEWKPRIPSNDSTPVIPGEETVSHHAGGETRNAPCEPSSDSPSSGDTPSESPPSEEEFHDLSPPFILESTLEGHAGQDETQTHLKQEHVPAKAVSNREQYLAMVEEAIDRHWISPPVHSEKPVVIVRFRIIPSGDISQIHIEQSSGNDHYDSAALRAIQVVNPLPPFPPKMRQAFLDVKFQFIRNKGN